MRRQNIPDDAQWAAQAVLLAVIFAGVVAVRCVTAIIGKVLV